jgi:PKD repeat protein
VRVTVRDPGNLSGFDQATVTIVTNRAPTADAGGPYGGGEGGAVAFDASGSTDPDGDALTYSWDFGDGNSPISSSSPLASHVYGDDGTFTVSVTVSDGTLSDTKSATVTIGNIAPTASFSHPAGVNEGDAFTLALSGAADASPADMAAGFTYAFDCGDGLGAFSGVPTRTCPTTDDDPRAVLGVVRDKDGGVSTYAGNVVVANVAPAVNAGADAQIYSGGSFAFSGSFSDPGADAPWSYNISWGNGVTSGSTSDPSAQITGTRQYFAAGSYPVQLSVTDKDNATGSDAAVVTVLRLPVGGGSGDEIINIDGVGHGMISIDVLSTSTLDVSSLVASTATLGNGVGTDTGVERRNNGTYMIEVKDINGDLILDVVLKFRRDAVKQTGDLTSTTTSLVLLADLADGRQLRGEYGVRIVP